MGIISRTGDLFYAFRFLKLLVTSWENMEAYRLGIIDNNGKILKKKADRKTPQEKSAYTIFHRLVFNIKRLLNKVPGSLGTKLATYASALFLVKEETGLDDDQLQKVLNDIFGDFDGSIDISESASWFDKNNQLAPGEYILVQEIASPNTAEIIANINTKVNVSEFTEPTGSIFGLNVYQVEHVLTKQQILITSADIKR
jgi:hypothetical protein|tara:strand:- start:11 stop:607 length:597 start_codon:yes stop_codon:yes gene_type:complete